MSLAWIHESPAYWDQNKARIIGAAPSGVFDTRFQRCQSGDLLPAEWWRVEDDGKTIGYGWLDVVWGDAEIVLVTDPETRQHGVGSFILKQIENEARQRGLNYLYNTVRPNHPDREQIAAWLKRRGFEESEDGSLFRTVATAKNTAG